MISNRNSHPPGPDVARFVTTWGEPPRRTAITFAPIRERTSVLARAESQAAFDAAAMSRAAAPPRTSSWG